MISVLEKAVSFPELVVSEYLPGQEYSVDLLVKNGEPLVVVSRRRDVTRLGISIIGTVEDNEEVVKVAKDTVRSLHLNYNINIQLKYSTDRIPKVIEINPRVSGTIVMCTGSGVNLPYLATKLALGEEIPKVTPRYGTRMLRYYEEIFISDKGQSYAL
jgi:carbamoyl-phosphate synthase large subunit